MPVWNPWHGCTKISAGCDLCYVYRIDSVHSRDSTEVKKTGSFNLPLKRSRGGDFKLIGGETVYTCFSSDFFLDKADEWRGEAWDMIRFRSDLHFFIITKRIERFHLCTPEDWGDGYDNVHISCTVENQAMADKRLPIFLEAPIKHKSITCEPLLEAIALERYLTPEIQQLIVGGESGKHARICDFDWVLGLREQCRCKSTPFIFRQTGSRFRKDGKVYVLPREIHASQARKANINLP